MTPEAEKLREKLLARDREIDYRIKRKTILGRVIVFGLVAVPVALIWLVVWIVSIWPKG